MSYTIKQVADMFNLPVTTIRYYDKEGLLPNLRRGNSGYRHFEEEDIAALRIIECLKKTGMQICEIRRFIELSKLGDKSLNERYELFLERKKAVEAQISELDKTHEILEHKCWYYETAIAAGTESIHDKDWEKKRFHKDCLNGECSDEED